MGIDCTGMGGSGNVKSHSRASLLPRQRRWKTSMIERNRIEFDGAGVCCVVWLEGDGDCEQIVHRLHQVRTNRL